MTAQIPEKIDHYVLLRSLGKGGMGEVFLASDPLCKRQVALKLIRQELKRHPIMKERFLREAHVAAQLTHPSIVPIFSIDPGPEKTYYTMPYVEGETLKTILKQSVEEEKEGEVRHPIGASIPALTRIFLSVCEAIAYTHSKGIVHRDLKPDNIIVGKYGEVLLLDWGLADFIGKGESPNTDEAEEADYRDLTHPGKVPGTLNYIAPERICGGPSLPATDIYSLGVILYQLLTLQLPFQRTSVKLFRKAMHLEKLIDPLGIAPYRDIPQPLAEIAKRCLKKAPEERYASVDDIIVELKNFLEGKPEWTLLAKLDTTHKQDWEFQENVLLSKHTAITKSPEVMEWVSLMLSRSSFSGNIKIETRLTVKKECQGVGLLLGIPEAEERKTLSDGYCIWMGKECRLFHNNVEVMVVPDAAINDKVPHDICVEKVDNHLFLYIDHKKIFHYISHIPLAGNHLGLLCRDADFEISPLTVMGGSQNVMVNCLAIPDAFLANKTYAKALLEYRKIASSFSGRSEGREAIFRGGITLLEEAAAHKKKKERERLQLMALEEFNRLRSTPAAPLEYLGKSLVYKATGEIEEEIKCLELCVRKYPGHPLLRQIREHILFRLHETSSRERIAAYHFALLALRHLGPQLQSPDHASLISSLKKHLEKLPWFLPVEPEEEHLACQLAFWLGTPMPLVDMVETSRSPGIIASAMYGLLAMGRSGWVEENLHYLDDPKEAPLVQIALLHFKKGPKAALEALCAHLSSPPGNGAMRCACFLFDRASLEGKSKEILPFFSFFPNTVTLDALQVSALLMQSSWKRAHELLDTWPPEMLGDEYSPLFVPMGCALAHAEGEEIAKLHFGGSIDLPHPPTTMLLSDYLRGKSTEKALPWEKISLYRQLSLYLHCTKNPAKAEKALKKLHQQLKKLSTP